jgi:CheY-like chemotaxis protein
VAVGAAGAPAEATAVAGATLMVVEDEPPLRAITARVLARAGYEVLTAANGEQALQLAETHPGAIDLVLTDVVMPDMLGQELAGELRRRRPELKVIFISGFARAALEQGPALDGPLLQKPVPAVELLSAIADCLSER